MPTATCRVLYTLPAADAAGIDTVRCEMLRAMLRAARLTIGDGLPPTPDTEVH